MFRIDMCVGKLCVSPESRNHGKTDDQDDQLSTWGMPWYTQFPLPVGRIPVFFLYLDSSLHQDTYGVWEVVDRDCSGLVDRDTRLIWANRPTVTSSNRWIRKNQSFFDMEKSGFI